MVEFSDEMEDLNENDRRIEMEGGGRRTNDENGGRGIAMVERTRRGVEAGNGGCWRGEHTKGK